MGHPDRSPDRFCHALADAYAESAMAAGHRVERIYIADFDIPCIASRAEWEDSVLCLGGEGPPPAGADRLAMLPEGLNYLADGDVVRLDPARGRIRVLYRRNSPSNSFLVTERCNHLCLMCSQPPRKVDDGWLVNEILEMIPLIDPGTREVGFTGGEPTILGERFLEILDTCKKHLPRTAVHVLTNGRSFADESFAAAYARVGHPDLMAGIPLYSDLSTIHDYVVQADGAYGETIRGILNLKRLSQLVEVRLVLHKQTYERLPQLAEFVA